MRVVRRRAKLVQLEAEGKHRDVQAGHAQGEGGVGARAMADVDGDATTEQRWVLYVAYDAHRPEQFCPGSRRCVGVLEVSSRLRARCSVQVVDQLLAARTPLPDWLDGTPILVDRHTRQLLRGSGACEYLSAQARADGGGAEAGAARPTRARAVAADGEFGALGDEEEDGGGKAQMDAAFETLGPPEGATFTDKKVTEKDVEAFMKRRQAALESGGRRAPVS